jgi:predicted O-methyltransferase YrrM
MYSLPILAKKYLQYWWKAANGRGHGTHSPFVFQFITKVLNDRSHYPAYDKVESLRRNLLTDQKKIKVEDLGAGSNHDASDLRSISSIARYAAKPKKIGQLLFRMVRYYQPSHILELGTSLGITSSYLSSGNPKASLVTIEGSSSIAAEAKKNFSDLQLSNCHLLQGNFDQLLPEVLSGQPQIELVFIDGNHRLEPTMKYFELLMKKTGPGSILIFDDIHWSAEMEEAWERIKADPRIKCSIDLFSIGIVFFREEFREKLSFIIRF